MPARPGTLTEAPITPLSLPRGVETVVLFGGTFDPPTVAHLTIPLEVCWSLPGHFPVYVPAARNPLKSTGAIASDIERVEMLLLSPGFFKNRSRTRASAIIWTDEIDRAAWQQDRGVVTPSYTIDTVNRLRHAIGTGFNIRLLIGADQALQFKRWHRWREILEIAEPIVLLRPPHDTPAAFIDALASEGFSPREQLAWARRIAIVRAPRVSSTRVRELLANRSGRSASRNERELQVLIPAPVLRYVEHHGVYGKGRGLQAERKRTK
jgi:nicotinate-nucleotide adenylyltransferase